MRNEGVQHAHKQIRNVLASALAILYRAVPIDADKERCEIGVGQLLAKDTRGGTIVSVAGENQRAVSDTGIGAQA